MTTFTSWSKMFPEGGPGQAGARLQRGRGQPSLHRGRPTVVCTQSPRQQDVLSHSRTERIL
jgi:hypothetical protein